MGFLHYLCVKNLKPMRKTILLCCLALVPSLLWSGETDVIWYDGHRPVSYSLPKQAPPVLKVAARMFSDDMQAVTGMVAEQTASGTICVAIAPKEVKQKDGFKIRVKGHRILVTGNNGRGAAYGLLEMSRMAGVSPWIWWGDVVPEHRSKLTLPVSYHTEQSPSVEYRGIFINDEDWSTRPWASENYEPGQDGRIGARSYRKIFELLLRLRANAMWPAMHAGTTAFFQVPGAKEMADSCGIVIGSSHCEPLLRNNLEEWNASVRGEYNYITNRKQVLDYWRERLQEMGKGADAMFTIGMRGIHDGSMAGVKTMKEKTDGLQRVIDDQQLLLRKYINKHVEDITQVFIPYKEVLEIYKNGLRIPDTATLLWCDDNYGYITHYPDTEQQKRSGGNGIYYHLSYWGRPHDHLWLTTTQPGLIYNEMKQAYDHGARKIWLANVHDPKVAGYDLELFLDMAWNIDALSPQTLSAHLGQWLCRQFGTQAGQLLLPAMEEWYRLCAIRRPEFMGWTQVELDKKKYERGLSPVTRTEMTVREADEYLAAYDAISRKVAQAAHYVRPELSDAYFAAVQYPVYASAAMARKILTDSCTSRLAYRQIQSMTDAYNKMRNGKWSGLMDANPRRLPVFGDVRAALTEDNAIVSPLLVMNACDYAKASDDARSIQLLGHSNRAVELSKGGSLHYTFQTAHEGKATIRMAFIPTHDNRFSVSVDGGKPQVYSLKEPFRSERWKQNVLRGQAVRTFECNLPAGSHTLEVRALDDHIIFDQWMLDSVADRNFYIFPIKSALKK